MAESSFDPGLTRQFGGRLRRSINRDGSFNVIRKGFTLRDTGIYLFLMTRTWPMFLFLVGLAFFAVNLVFAILYALIGIENLQGAHNEQVIEGFLDAFFFSVQTFTTVGYGHMAPRGVLTSLVAAIEAMFGLLAFAIGTGLMWGRFSRPSADLVFSNQMVVAPFQGGASLQFRVANRRPNVLMEIEAKMLLMTVENENGELKRVFKDLSLDVPSVYFLPLTWTVVHPITSSSPLFGLGEADLRERQAELLILVKAFDDTFSQVVHARCSYTFDEIVWGARYARAFEINEDGDLVLSVDRIHDHREA